MVANIVIGGADCGVRDAGIRHPDGKIWAPSRRRLTGHSQNCGNLQAVESEPRGSSSAPGIENLVLKDARPSWAIDALRRCPMIPVSDAPALRCWIDRPDTTTGGGTRWRLNISAHCGGQTTADTPRTRTGFGMYGAIVGDLRTRGEWRSCGDSCVRQVTGATRRRRSSIRRYPGAIAADDCPQQNRPGDSTLQGLPEGRWRDAGGWPAP